MPSAEYIRLEDRLTLLGWLNRQFGYARNQDLLKELADVGEGWDASGRSHVTGRLLSTGDRCRIAEADLARYDANVRRHLEAMNRGRLEPITLRYFQHLAALCTELFLDRWANRRAGLLADLNRFVAERNGQRLPGDPEIERFVGGDLTKLAFWMATGSGKTLLMHLHYRQFLHYRTKPPDNILLITPNEGLTQQHLEQFAQSGIPAERFALERSGLLDGGRNAVRVIEITKLVGEKRGDGVSVPVEAFQGDNLIFVDEGHKGSGGETWRKYRDQLAETGFTFEYSATFGQALNAVGNDGLTREYAKCIAFDYSYRYFYGDGFGKDFRILNLRGRTAERDADLLLTANLLSFYEQIRVHETAGANVGAYNLARPLWLFVGRRVDAVYSEGGRKRSDILTVVDFLRRFLGNEGGRAAGMVADVLEGRHGLVSADGVELFAGDFETLRKGGRSPGAVYADAVKRLFGAPAAGGLEVNTIRSAPGEMGLRVRGQERYFGLIYIGDVPAFRELVDRELADLEVGEDAIVGPLFPALNRAGSPLTMLIGAKKFIEGWDSWRVSSMCLLNVGKSEGSEIIQLFGRGVRLKGWRGTLKRSTALGPDRPREIRPLERLNLFAIRADYMAQFRDYLEREGVDTGGTVELELPLWNQQKHLKEDLYVPRWPAQSTFQSERVVALDADPDAAVRHDVSARVDAILGARGQIHTGVAGGGVVVRWKDATLNLLDWPAIHACLLGHRERAGYHNLVVPYGMPRRILATRDPVLCELRGPVEWSDPGTMAHMAALQAAAGEVLARYMDCFFRLAQRRWDGTCLDFTPLGVKEPTIRNYQVRVPRSDPALVKRVQDLIRERAKRLRASVKELPNLDFDRHVYQPLLAEAGDLPITFDPPGLNPGERKFVEDLKGFCAREEKGLLVGKKLFLLRNLGKGRGIGFFESAGFFPDFILWIKERGRQRVIFVEPHGMLHENHPLRNEKVRLHERLRADAAAGLARLKVKLELDAWIVSQTGYDVLRNRWMHDDKTSWTREELGAAHILFPDDGTDAYLRAIVG